MDICVNPGFSGSWLGIVAHTIGRGQLSCLHDGVDANRVRGAGAVDPHADAPVRHLEPRRQLPAGRVVRRQPGVAQQCSTRGVRDDKRASVRAGPGVQAPRLLE